MKNKASKNEVKSNFNHNEKFDINNIPKQFKSVTSDSLARLKQAELDKAMKIGEMKPKALLAMLEAADGQFDGAYSVLEGDYRARKANLQAAYSQGVSDIRKAFKSFELQVEEYNVAFQKYSEANKVLNGNYLSEKLMFSKEEMDKIREDINNL